MPSRRAFVKTSAAAAVALVAAPRLMHAATLHLPLGLQLYSVREMTPKDFAGTLKMVSAAGFKEVEAAGFFGHSATDIKKAMQDANLKCVSSHHNGSALHADIDALIAFHKELGTEYIICSSTGPRIPVAALAHHHPTMSLDDWRWNAEEFNKIGEKLHNAGIKFGYHNHTPEFTKIDGTLPWVEMLNHTDPRYVNFELDCGWAVVAGADPVALLRDYSARIVMMHVKDFHKPAVPAGPESYKVTELGRGDIDYRPIFAEAAKHGRVKHIFVEQEAFDMPADESLKTDAAYVMSLEK